MIVQDTLTGTLHEVPEGQVYEAPEPVGETVYDGLGNPIGLFSPFRAIGRLFRRRRRGGAEPPPPEVAPGPEMAPPPDMPPPEEAGQGEVYDGFGNPLGMIPFPIPTRRSPILGLPLPRLPFGGGPRRSVWSPILRRFVSMVWNPAERRWVTAPGAPPPGPYPGRPWWQRIPPGWQRGQLPLTGANRLYLRCTAWPGPAGLTPILPPGAPGMPGMPGAPGGRRRRRFRRSRR